MIAFFSLLEATWTTIGLALCSIILGMVLAFVFVIWEASRFKPWAIVGTGLVTLIRGLPEMLVVLFVHYSILIFLFNLSYGIEIPLYFTTLNIQFDWYVSPFISGVLALSLLYAAYASQTLRGAIKAIPVGQWESGQVLGLSRPFIFFRLIMPQMWRHALPGLGNQWLILLKDTALVWLISVHDIMMQAKAISDYTHKPFTWYMIAAALYLIISLISQFILKQLENKAARYI